MSAYPTVMTTTNVMILLGIPLEMKCLTLRYLFPVCESSNMIAAVSHLSRLVMGCFKSWRA